MVFFDAEGTDAESYNQPWGKGENAFPLPVTLGASVGTWDIEGDPIKLARLRGTYSPWSLLRDSRSDLLSQVEITGYRKLTLEKTGSPLASVLWSTASGDPLVVMAERGEGKVVHFAIAADADGSTLPLRMVYLPMMQHIGHGLSRKSSKPHASCR